MNDVARLISKVLVLERDPASMEALKRFCDENDLVGLKVPHNGAMPVLKSNVDLGGIFLAEDYGAGLALAHAIHAVRPELPIFLRRTSAGELAPADRRVVRCSYELADIDSIRPEIAESIFSLVYPNALVRGISELTVEALRSQFPHLDVEAETPCIVRDCIIHGELFTLIPLESSWCRGYMMLQTAEEEMRAILRMDDSGFGAPGPNFHDLNNALGETTNLIWGKFKNRYISYGDQCGHLTQIPIVINHGNRCMSFGSDNPQLCFRYTLTDRDRPDTPPTSIHQRFIFNLAWSPEDFTENQASVEDLFESGELELF
jgi:hypothetical protein